MKKGSIIYVCDICKKEEIEMQSINYPVKFLTEQTEGRGVEPYISQQQLDVCRECLNKIIHLTGTGAMGYNKYEIY